MHWNVYSADFRFPALLISVSQHSCGEISRICAIPLRVEKWGLAAVPLLVLSCGCLVCFVFDWTLQEWGEH